MIYQNRSIRCPHGFDLDLVRCEECEGRWRGKQKVEKRRGRKPHRVSRDRVPTPPDSPKYTGRI